MNRGSYLTTTLLYVGLLATSIAQGGNRVQAALTGQVEDPKASPRELVESVIAGLVDNDSRMQEFRAVFTATVENRGIDERIRQVTKRPDGITTTLIIEPKSESKPEYIISGNKVRLEVLGDTWISSGPIVTQYVPESKDAWIRR
jgi:hypothetical protein